MHRVTTATLAAGVLALCVGRLAAAPVETPIVITQPPINANLQTYTGGSNYTPAGPTTITVGGIPFDLAGFSPGPASFRQTILVSRSPWVCRMLLRSTR